MATDDDPGVASGRASGASVRVSVLMPVRAPAPHIAEALLSVVKQTFEAWELVLVNDGADPSVTAIARELVPESRLQVVELATPSGLCRALNAGLEVAQGEFIARLDSDDRSRPDRLARQVAVVDRRPGIVLLGSSARLIDERGFPVGTRDVSDIDTRRLLLRRNQFVHSSVMFRRDAVAALWGYAEDCTLREDYELWLRLAAVGEVANLTDPLVDYRLSSAQISHQFPSRLALRRVAAAQRDLRGTVGLSRPEAVARRLAWRAAQGRVYRSVSSGAFPRPAATADTALAKDLVLATPDQIHRYLAAALAEVSRTAIELGIEYVLIAGSALGARRHGGLIPWDDDIDIAMTRDAFDRFIQEGPEALTSKLTVQTRADFDGQGAAGKIYVDNSLTHGDFGAAHGLRRPNHLGIFIDLFIFYRLSRYSMIRYVERLLGRALYVRPWALRMALSKGTVPASKRMRFVAATIVPRGVAKRLEAVMWRHSETRNGADLGIGLGGSNGETSYPPSMIFPPQELPFGDVSALVPRDLDAFLARTFGEDFMTPPPVHLRSPHAAQVFLPPDPLA